MTTIYVALVLNIKTVVGHIGDGAEWFNKPSIGGIVPSRVFTLFLRYIVPVVILLVLLNMVGALRFFSGA